MGVALHLKTLITIWLRLKCLLGSLRASSHVVSQYQWLVGVSLYGGLTTRQPYRNRATGDSIYRRDATWLCL
jgi:hypothetical protein